MDLQARLAANSSNSSRPPPSSDPPSVRQRGGQPGHLKHERRLLPPERVTQTTTVRPTACRRGGKSLPGHEPTDRVAERAIRPAVLGRKGSFGRGSAPGSRFVERILTVVWLQQSTR